MAENGLVGRMHMEGRGNEKQEGILGREFDAGKVATACDLSSLVERAHTSPVVEGLQGQMQVVVGFQFEDGEAALARDGEQIQQGSAG